MTRPKNILVISDAAAADENYNVAHVLDALRGKGFVVDSFVMNKDRIKGLPRQAPTALLLYFPCKTSLPLARLAEKLKALYASQNVPIIAVNEQSAPDLSPHIDSAMITPVHSAQVATRLMSFIRLKDMQEEFKARQDTIHTHFGIAPKDINIESNATLRVLFIGKAAPQFMVMINALQDKNVKVIAAFTSFTAFDYLHDEDFDAVVINGLGGEEPAFTISSTMRRNSRLFHVPVVLLSSAATPNMIAQAHDKGISDIIISDAPPAEISSRILELARFHKAHALLKSAFLQLGNSDILDMRTGLFTQEFFKFHSHHLAETAQKDGNMLTLAMLTVSTESHQRPAEHSMQSACVQIGGMIKNLIRTEDCAAWLAPQNFAVLCPGERKEHVEKIAQRISEILQETAFDGEDGPFRIKVSYNLADLSCELSMNNAEDVDSLDQKLQRTNNAL